MNQRTHACPACTCPAHTLDVVFTHWRVCDAVGLECEECDNCCYCKWSFTVWGLSTPSPHPSPPAPLSTYFSLASFPPFPSISFLPLCVHVSSFLYVLPFHELFVYFLEPHLSFFCNFFFLIFSPPFSICLFYCFSILFHPYVWACFIPTSACL